MWRDLGITKQEWNATPLAVRTVLFARQQQVRLIGIRFTADEKQLADLRDEVATLDDLKAGSNELRDHIEGLDGESVTGFVTDNVTGAWIDFTYCGHRFSVNDQLGDYWFFVADPKCPDGILEAVLSHCKLLLGAGRNA